MGGFIPLPVEISFTCRIPVGIARSVPGGFIGGFAMKNACAIVLQVKEKRQPNNRHIGQLNPNRLQSRIYGN